MNKQEAAKIIAVLATAYPEQYRKISREEAANITALWAEMFSAEPFELVAAGVKALIATKTDSFAPSIGAVKAKIATLREPDVLTEVDAWALVSKACANGIYGYKKEFAKLPPEVQAAVGCAEQIRIWAMMDAETVQSVVASNFMRSYKAKSARYNELALMPPDVRNLIGGLANTFALEEGSR